MTKNRSVFDLYHEADHVVVDIETLGTDPDTVVLSIGAVRMVGDRVTDDTFYVTIDYERQIKDGRSVTGSTLKWWMDQRSEVRAEAMKAELPPGRAVSQFLEWLGKEEYTFIWGNAPSFDMAILSSLFKDHGAEAPWTHQQERDIRTFCTGYLVSPRDRKRLKSELNMRAHVALDDAVYEAHVLSLAIKKIAKLHDVVI